MKICLQRQSEAILLLIHPDVHIPGHIQMSYTGHLFYDGRQRGIGFYHIDVTRQSCNLVSHFHIAALPGIAMI